MAGPIIRTCDRLAQAACGLCRNNPLALPRFCLPSGLTTPVSLRGRGKRVILALWLGVRPPDSLFADARLPWSYRDSLAAAPARRHRRRRFPHGPPISACRRDAARHKNSHMRRLPGAIWPPGTRVSSATLLQRRLITSMFSKLIRAMPTCSAARFFRFSAKGTSMKRAGSPTG